MPMAFNPVTGLLNTTTYPTTPANETAARQQFMDLFYQARDYMNNSLAAKNPSVTWIAPTLINAWVNYGTGYTNAGYYKDDLGFVHIVGAVKSGTTVVFTLPVGYRPLTTKGFTVSSYNGTSYVVGNMNVGNDGTITILGSTSNVYLSLEGISFLAEQ